MVLHAGNSLQKMNLHCMTILDYKSCIFCIDLKHLAITDVLGLLLIILGIQIVSLNGIFTVVGDIYY